MNFVATDTGHLIDFMSAALPFDVPVILMALQTDAILQRNTFLRLRTKIDYRRTLMSWPDLGNMTAGSQHLLQKQPTTDTRPMTGLALQPGKRRARIPFQLALPEQQR